MPDRDIEPIRVEALPARENLWSADSVTLPMAGNWEGKLCGVITNFDEATLSKDALQRALAPNVCRGECCRDALSERQ